MQNRRTGGRPVECVRYAIDANGSARCPRGSKVVPCNVNKSGTDCISCATFRGVSNRKWLIVVILPKRGRSNGNVRKVIVKRGCACPRIIYSSNIDPLKTSAAKAFYANFIYQSIVLSGIVQAGPN